MSDRTRLLVVDDNRADADYILTLLRESAPDKFDAAVAENISSTLNAISGGDVEIITLDLFLSDSQGLGTLLAVRAKAPDIPVVVVSGLDDQKTAQEAMYYGAHAYLVKGEFDGQQLLQAMVRAMARQSQIILELAIKQMQRDLEHSKAALIRGSRATCSPGTNTGA